MDKEKVLNKLAEMEAYVTELKNIMPMTYSKYETSIEKKRACERLLQISIETIIDVCNIFVIELKLGLPSGEDDIFEKLRKSNVISSEMFNRLKKMRKFRNVLVHRYGIVDDRKVFYNIKKNLKDFKDFKNSIVRFLKKR